MAQLRILNGCQKNHALLLIPPGPYRLGRSFSSDFQLADRHVSRKHFTIDFLSEGYLLQDVGSRTGTFVNDVRVKKGVVKDGDRVRAGFCDLVLEFADEDELVGREFGGYQILERVGHGGMGTVYRARQTSLQRVVALKVLAKNLASDREFSSLFIREARSAAELSHPHIVRVYDVNRVEGVLFYAMELTARGSLEDLIRREVRLDERTALSLAIQATQGLEYSEKVGIVHRDIKPANLMLHETGRLKIGDLGIASRTEESAGKKNASNPTGISGSPPYMSPEQVLGRQVDHRSDLYSLGATLYEMLTGVPPFRGDTVQEILYAHIRESPPDPRARRGDVSVVVAKMVRRLLAKKPDDRFASASELRAHLEEILATGRFRGAWRQRVTIAHLSRKTIDAIVFVAAVVAGAVGIALLRWLLIL